MNNLSFNPSPPFIMHLDLNSCFATIEQQANPLLRGKPIVVAAYTTPGGCIIAPSVEAKKLGIKVGMRVKEGKLLCSDLIVLAPDPWKYRNIHLRLRRLISDYTDDFTPKSIDEFVLNLEGYPCLINSDIQSVAREIKQRIKSEIGEWLTISVGIAPNRYLAKVAASLHKPDGLDEINKDNFLDCYSQLKLTDLPWIKDRNAVRLNQVGILSVLDFYQASYWQLKAAFQSVLAYYWYLRLRGFEIDNFPSRRKSYGNSYALPKPLTKASELAPILARLTEKMSTRLRRAGFMVRGIHLALLYRDFSFWHKAETLKKQLFDSKDIYKELFRLLTACPFKKPVRELHISAFNLEEGNHLQLEIFNDIEKKKKLVDSIDKVNERWGNFVIYPARMLNTETLVLDRIAFGGIKELEEQILTR